MTNTLADQLPRALCACPAWCDKPDGHPYETTEGDGTESRFHVHHVMDVEDVASIEITALAKAATNGAPEVMGEALINLYISTGEGTEDAYADNLTASRALALAGVLGDGLTSAAEWLEAQR